MDAHDRTPSDPDAAAEQDREEDALDADEEKFDNDALEDAGLLPLPDAEPADGPAPAP